MNPMGHGSHHAADIPHFFVLIDAHIAQEIVIIQHYLPWYLLTLLWLGAGLICIMYGLDLL